MKTMDTKRWQTSDDQGRAVLICRKEGTLSRVLPGGREPVHRERDREKNAAQSGVRYEEAGRLRGGHVELKMPGKISTATA